MTLRFITHLLLPAACLLSSSFAQNTTPEQEPESNHCALGKAEVPGTDVNNGSHTPPKDYLAQAKRHTQLAHVYWQLGRFDSAQLALSDATAALHHLPENEAAGSGLPKLIERMRGSIRENREEYYKHTGNGKDRNTMRATMSFDDEVEQLCTDTTLDDAAEQLARQFAPSVAEWKKHRLGADIVLLTGHSQTAYAFGIDNDAIFLYAVRNERAKPRCVLCTAEPLAWLREARFRLVGNGIEATLPDGLTVGRYALWTTPPDRHAPAPQLVVLRCTELKNNKLHIEARNKTAHSIALGRGFFYAQATMADGTVYPPFRTGSTRQTTEIPPYESRTISAELTPDAVDTLQRAEHIHLSFHCASSVRLPQSDGLLCPRLIPPDGLPDWQSRGAMNPGIIVDAGTVVLQEDAASGRYAMLYHIFTLRDGVWTLTTSLRYHEKSSLKKAPQGYRKEGNTLHLLDTQGNSYSTIELPTVP